MSRLQRANIIGHAVSTPGVNDAVGSCKAWHALEACHRKGLASTSCNTTPGLFLEKDHRVGDVATL